MARRRTRERWWRVVEPTAGGETRGQQQVLLLVLHQRLVAPVNQTKAETQDETR